MPHMNDSQNTRLNHQPPNLNLHGEKCVTSQAQSRHTRRSADLKFCKQNINTMGKTSEKFQIRWPITLFVAKWNKIGPITFDQPCTGLYHEIITFTYH